MVLNDERMVLGTVVAFFSVPQATGSNFVLKIKYFPKLFGRVLKEKCIFESSAGSPKPKGPFLFSTNSKESVTQQQSLARHKEKTETKEGVVGFF